MNDPAANVAGPQDYNVLPLPPEITAAIIREFPDGRLDSTLGDAIQRREHSGRVAAAIDRLASAVDRSVSWTAPDWYYERSFRVMLPRPGTPPWSAFARMRPDEQGSLMRRSQLGYWKLQLCGYAPYSSTRVLCSSPQDTLLVERSELDPLMRQERDDIDRVLATIGIMHLAPEIEEATLSSMDVGEFEGFPAFENGAPVRVRHCLFGVA